MKAFFTKVLLVIITIFFGHSSFGQQNYQPGIIITLDGDTLQGFIDYRNWEKNPNKVHFSSAPEADSRIYSAFQIKSFEVADEIYKSAIVNVEVSPYRTDDLNYNPEFQYEVDTTFLQTIFRGPTSLYYYKNKKGNENFYIGQEGEIILLDHKKYLKEQVEANVITENKRYIGQLAVYLGDCPSIQSKLKNMKYTGNHLESLFLFYYDCTKQDLEFEKETEKLTLETSILMGVSLATVNIRGDYPDYFVDTDYPPSLKFTAGISFDVRLPRNLGSWSICNDIIFSSFNTNGTHLYYLHENRQTTTYSEIGLSYLKIYNLGRFRYPVKNVWLYINSGISYGVTITKRNYRRSEIKFYTSERVEEGSAVGDIGGLNFGFVAGLGAKYKKFSFEWRYEHSSNFIASQDQKATPNFYFFMFGYQFGKEK